MEEEEGKKKGEEAIKKLEAILLEVEEIAYEKVKDPKEIDIMQGALDEVVRRYEGAEHLLNYIQNNGEFNTVKPHLKASVQIVREELSEHYDIPNLAKGKVWGNLTFLEKLGIAEYLTKYKEGHESLKKTIEDLIKTLD